MSQDQKSDINPLNLIEKSLWKLNLIGLDPNQRSKFKVIWALFLMICIFGTFILQTAFILTNEYKDFGFLMVDVILLSGYWQHAVKLYTLFTKHHQLKNLIEIIAKQFWSLDELKQKHRVNIQKIYNITSLSARSYTYGIFVTLAGHYLTAWFRGNENLIMNIWLPQILVEINRTPLGHGILFSIELILMHLTITCGLIEIDVLYIILNASALAQYKILKLKLICINGETSIKNNMDTIIKCIKHHNLLFKYFAGIQEIFSLELLHIAGSIIVLSVISIYSSMTEQDITRIIAYFFMFVAVMAMLFIYCFIGQLIQDETVSVAEAAYQCKWEDIPDKNIRNNLILIILRSQNHVKITMGGLFILSLDTYTKVSRMMLSLLTFMMNMNN